MSSQAENVKMQTSQSYPSPSAMAVGTGTGPFYNQGPRLSPPESLQLAAAPPSRTTLPPLSVVSGEKEERSSTLPPGSRRPEDSPSDQLGPMDIGDPNNESMQTDATTPRKRSKVSRACDECRRKKIRCDATSESGMEQCSSCKRVGTRCQFSRVPMKRGPSKGYIKELADRLNTLENSMIQSPSGEMPYGSQPGPETQSPRASEGYSPVSSAAAGSKQVRKRTHSGPNNPPHGVYLQQLPQRSAASAWSAQDTPRHLPHPTSTFPTPQTPHSTSSAGDPSSFGQAYRSQFSPRDRDTQPLWVHGPPDLARAAGTHSPYDATEPRLVGLDRNTAILDWHEQTVDEYYHTIHPTFPFLPHSKSRLRSRLANCPVTLREAFLEALYAAVRPGPASQVMSPPGAQGPKKAADLIAASQFESPATRTTSTNLIYLQTMILMAIEADRLGPAAVRGQPGPPKAVWLGSAVGLAYHLRLHSDRSSEKMMTPNDDDVDSDERIGRRNWWALVVLDRWHASSTSSPLLIPDTSVGLLPEDQVLLGDSPFHLSRLSIILGHLSTVFTTASSAFPELSTTSSSNPLVSKLLHGELERFREHIQPSLPSQPIPHLAYWHILLLVKRHTPSASLQDLLAPSQQIASLLFSHHTPPSSPLHHHFLALATTTLIELSSMPPSSVSDDAFSTLEAVLTSLDERRRRSTVPTIGGGWDDLLVDLIRAHLKTRAFAPSGRAASRSPHLSSAGLARGSLQHLADLAVSGNERSRSGTREPRSSRSSPEAARYTSGGAAGFDATALTRGGYLNTLGGARSSTPGGSDR